MTMGTNQKWISQILASCSRDGNKRLLISNRISKTLHTVEDKKRAAVLIPLCNRNNKASILFTKRTDNVGTHKGQVSFPGGHLNPGESDIDAAVRESYEELGTNIGKIEILGVCQTIPAITGTLVTPIIGFLNDDVGEFQNYNPNSLEVSTIFTRSIEQLSSADYRTHQTLNRYGQEFQLPVFGENDEFRIWGLTAMILDAVLQKVIIPNKPHDEDSF
jgi:8-oxo-dGTP pyrophosphatase MutT (NUDIX family)